MSLESMVKTIKSILKLAELETGNFCMILNSKIALCYTLEEKYGPFMVYFNEDKVFLKTQESTLEIGLKTEDSFKKLLETYGKKTQIKAFKMA